MCGGAQDTRTQLVRDAEEAYDNFETARAMQLLSVALNPSIGAPDETWASGVQLLAQILIEEGSDSLANVWMRWAVRTAPDMPVDSIAYLPEVINAYYAARTLVGAGTEGDVVTETAWDWSGSGRGDLGSLRIVSTLPVPLEITSRDLGTFRGVRCGSSRPCPFPWRSLRATWVRSGQVSHCNSGRAAITSRSAQRVMWGLRWCGR